jgi:hypothetical protein
MLSRAIVAAISWAASTKRERPVTNDHFDLIARRAESHNDDALFPDLVRCSSGARIR